MYNLIHLRKEIDVNMFNGFLAVTSMWFDNVAQVFQGLLVGISTWFLAFAWSNLCERVAWVPGYVLRMVWYIFISNHLLRGMDFFIICSSGSSMSALFTFKSGNWNHSVDISVRQLIFKCSRGSSMVALLTDCGHWALGVSNIPQTSRGPK